MSATRPRPKFGWTASTGVHGWQIGDKVRPKHFGGYLFELVDGPFHTDTDGDPNTSGGEYWWMRVVAARVGGIYECGTIVKTQLASGYEKV